MMRDDEYSLISSARTKLVTRRTSITHVSRKKYHANGRHGNDVCDCEVHESKIISAIHVSIKTSVRHDSECEWLAFRV